MEKQSVVKSVPEKPFEKKEKDKDYTFMVEFENGDKGFFHNPTQTQDYFKLGSLVSYEIEEHTKKDGQGKYYIIYKPGEKAAADAAKANGKKGYAPAVKTPKQIKLESRTMTLRYAVDLAINKAIPFEKMEEAFKKLNYMLDESIDKLESSTVATV